MADTNRDRRGAKDAADWLVPSGAGGTKSDAAPRRSSHLQSLVKRIFQAVCLVRGLLMAPEEIDAMDFAFLANNDTDCAKLRLD